MAAAARRRWRRRRRRAAAFKDCPRRRGSFMVRLREPVARRRGQEAFARRPVGRSGPARERASTPRTRPPSFSLMDTPTRAPQVRAHTRTINNVKKGSPETTTPPA